MEAHSPISALISESLQYQDDFETRRFDGFWSSSLTDYTEMGKPDIEVLDLSHRTKNIGDIFDPEIHEAISQIPAIDDKQKGKIIDIIQGGYKLGDIIINFPKVVVAQ